MLNVRPQDLQVQRYSWRQYKPQRESREYFTEKSVKYSRSPETRNLGSESPLVQGCTVATQISSFKIYHEFFEVTSRVLDKFVYTSKFKSPGLSSSPLDVTWSAPWTSSTTTTSTVGGSSWSRRGEGARSPGQGRGAGAGAGAGSELQLKKFLFHRLLRMKINMYVAVYNAQTARSKCD